MSRKHQLRTDRSLKSPIINATSKGQETEVVKALHDVVTHLGNKFDKKISLVHEKQWHLKNIVSELKLSFPLSFTTTSIAVRYAQTAAYCIFKGNQGQVGYLIPLPM